MSTTKKLTQAELRQLMREKAQGKVTKRIESPLAKYDEAGKLWCVVCNIVIHSESIWSSHLIEKSHKKNIEKLKQLRLQPKPELPNKRPLEKVDKDVKANSKFAKLSEFSQKEISIKSKKTKIKDEESNKSEQTETVHIESLPQDFFDGGLKPEVQPTNSKPNSSDILDGTVPMDFFDNSTVDAKSRKVITTKDPFEEQMELFRKEIAQESVMSEIILEEEIEQLQKEKTISEIDEQITNWEKVNQYQKKIEEIHNKKKRQSENVQKNKTNDSKGSDDDDDKDDDDDLSSLNDINFWRSKDGAIPNTLKQSSIVLLPLACMLFSADVVVELKNDLRICGTLHSVDQYLNFKLTDINVVNSEKYPYMVSVKNCFIRGSVVRYVHLNREEVDVTLLQDAARKEATSTK
ncbi:U6 snRNA-associated Sm-like protein LSm2 [Blomia tropicalis]|nr:U6 snRNA-associated Sm-like protein LSm2 [Blomia tropicalis]